MPDTSMSDTLFGDFPSARTAWESLQDIADAHPFQHYAWQETWYATIGTAHAWQPAILVLEDANAPAGRSAGEGNRVARKALLPLGVTKRHGLRRLAWMGEGVSDYLGPLVHPAGSFSAEELIGAIRALGRRLHCDYIDLDRNPADLPSGPNPIVASIPPANPGFRPVHYRAYSMTVPENMESWLASRFSSKERYNLRRAGRQLAAAGELAFEVTSQAADREALTLRMIDLKRARYRAIGAFDNFADPSFARFYIEAARNFDIGVHLSALTLDGDPIALHWGLRAASRMYYLMPAFAAGPLDRFSPGIVFLGRFIDLCRAEGIHTLDFTIGDEDYKRKWCDASMVLYRYDDALTLSGKWLIGINHFADFLRASRVRTLVVGVRKKLRRFPLRSPHSRIG